MLLTINLISEDMAATAGGSSREPCDRHLTRSRCLSELVLMGALGYWEA